VLGEILAGILLGPTAFGAWFPQAYAALFPSEGPVPVALHGLTTLAVIMFLMVAGMEVDLSAVWKQGKAALAVGGMGIAVPFALGFVPAWLAPSALGAKPDSDAFIFALFIATAMAITALPVVAKILLELNLFRTDMGVTVLAAAIINDLIGWIIFALILTLLGGSSGSLAVWHIALLTLAFTVLMLTAGRWLVNRSLPWVQAHTSWPGGVLGFGLTAGLLCAAFTEAIGVHAIFGAFLFGVALGDSVHLRRRTRATMEQFVSFVFAPLFFANIGLRVDFVRNFDPLLTVIVLGLATLGKVGGCTLAARWAGFPPREARAVGFGMNARGAMEIILGLLALNAGIIGERLFVALVVMALVTSMTSGILIQRSFGRRETVRFIDFVAPRAFLPSLQVRDRDEAIAALARLAAEAGAVDAESAAQAVCQREQLVSSAVGNGLAIPHARLSDIKRPAIAVGLCPRGMDFDAPDGQPVFVVILVLTPVENTNVHLSILADIARIFSSERVVHKLVTRVSTFTQLRAFINIEAPRPAPAPREAAEAAASRE
jgi:Kef-type K+ transport system membrane component KefB/mannitol/fructose-specific phosphotransferase system IIA component (Ntr-type)